MQTVLEIIGWVGSALLVFSVVQSRFMRFRVLNLVASAVLVAYNAALQVWPMVAVNAALVVIDFYYIWKLQRDRRADQAFTYAPADAGLADWFLQRFGDDLAGFHPDIVADLPAAQAAAIFHDDRVIGLVAWRPLDGGVAELLADYVIPAYRDFHPGVFVYSPAGPLRQAGVRVVHIDQPKHAVAAYLKKLGFEETALDRLQLTFS
jgi:hypothetical protein